MSTRIALRTTQIPPVTSPHQEIIAIIELTPERALELLELMREITMRASASSTTFRISSFERAALYAPACALTVLPSPGDFVILPNDYTVTASSLTPMKLVHTNVMPLFINWTAIAQNDRFLINSTELNVEVLRAIAYGFPIPPGATRLYLQNLQLTSDDTTLLFENNWLH